MTVLNNVDGDAIHVGGKVSSNKGNGIYVANNVIGGGSIAIYVDNSNSETYAI